MCREVAPFKNGLMLYVMINDLNQYNSDEDGPSVGDLCALCCFYNKKKKASWPFNPIYWRKVLANYSHTHVNHVPFL